MQGRVFLVRPVRAGSAYTKVVCAVSAAPPESTSAFKLVRRPKAFLTALEQGCATSSTGRFIFEQKPYAAPTVGSGALGSMIDLLPGEPGGATFRSGF